MNSQKPKTIHFWNRASCRLLHEYKSIKENEEEINFKIINFSEIWFNKLRKRLIRKNIDHPYFHKCLQDFFKIWFSSSIKTQREKNQELYSNLGNINLYSLSHAICCGLIPQNFHNRNMPLIDFINKKEFAPNRRWLSYDYIKRHDSAREIALWIKKNISKFYEGKPCLVIDYAGGNGEWSIHLSRFLKQMNLDKKVFIIVKEINKGMIKEGKEKIKANKFTNIIFFNSSIEIPFDSIRDKLPRKLKSSPVIASISSYTMGALPRNIISDAIIEMHNSLSKGGKCIIWDFADQNDDIISFLTKTKIKGIIYQITRIICKKPLYLCYKNWDHSIDHIGLSADILKSREIKFSSKWFISTCTIIPLFCIGKKVVSLNIPGYVERTLQYIKK